MDIVENKLDSNLENKIRVQSDNLRNLNIENSFNNSNLKIDNEATQNLSSSDKSQFERSDIETKILIKNKSEINKSNNRKILIVEDKHFMNNTIKKLLEKIIIKEKLEIKVIQCYDGIDLLKEITDDQC